MEKYDAISRSALLNGGIKAKYGYNEDGLLLIPMRDVLGSIKNAPSLDVAQVVRAHWVKDDEGHTRCSSCMKRLPFVHCYSDVTYVEWYEEIEETQCCPHCGAKMDEKEDENDR